MSKIVADWMNRDLITVKPNTPLADAVKLLVDRHISGLPVIDDDGKLVGVISESDLMWREQGLEQPPYMIFLGGVIYFKNPLTYDRDLHKALGQTVGEVMTPYAISISADTLLSEAARILHDKKIHRLPVVDENNHPIGIITESDIVRAIAAV
ncbi:CBS domain-containing protein [Chamaesiphon polymorphus]|uniref:Phosphoribulokinase n=1 Tax=Chamaesiphon polymorphus CCALA 037 TaxID=2107692 RepID=A0A2T1FHZ4_9CYAN|nr:CBS domain-containing protein [Chamaesiphon polymorphus]PSB44571.1 phosphoribulokinase [Chamaesiphon polymorphus CCALA 037]